MPVVYTATEGSGFFAASNVTAASAITDPTDAGDAYSESIVAISAIIDALEAADILATS